MSLKMRKIDKIFSILFLVYWSCIIISQIIYCNEVATITKYAMFNYNVLELIGVIITFIYLYSHKESR